MHFMLFLRSIQLAFAVATTSHHRQFHQKHSQRNLLKMLINLRFWLFGVQRLHFNVLLNIRIYPIHMFDICELKERESYGRGEGVIKALKVYPFLMCFWYIRFIRRRSNMQCMYRYNWRYRHRQNGKLPKRHAKHIN